MVRPIDVAAGVGSGYMELESPFVKGMLEEDWETVDALLRSGVGEVPATVNELPSLLFLLQCTLVDPETPEVGAEQLADWVRLLCTDRGQDPNEVVAIPPEGHEFSAATLCMATAPIEVVRALVECGARVDIRGASFRPTPIHTAAISNREEVVQLLLDNGADASCSTLGGDGHGWVKPLYLAAISPVDSPGVIRLLVEAGADMEAVSVGCPSALLALLGDPGSPNVIERLRELISLGVDVQRKTLREEKNALHLAIGLAADGEISDIRDVIPALVEAGLSPDEPDADGLTARQLATEKGLDDLFEG